jgi:hypothetical protein
MNKAIISHLSRLFWDHSLAEEDFNKHPVWVTERVLEYGTIDDVIRLRKLFGKEHFLEVVSQCTRISSRTLNFWSKILEMEGVPCTKKFSRNTAWNY